MKKILVTGGCGYIGSHTIVSLLEKGYDVISVDDFERGKPYVPDRITQITGKKIFNYRTNVCQLRSFRTVFTDHKDIEGIIHFAAHKMVGESVQRPLKYYANNISSLMNVLYCIREFNIPELIFSSSSSVYGNIGRLPLTEDSPAHTQTSPYGRTKYFGEQIIQDMLAVHNFKALSLRYFNPAGAHESALLGEPLEEKPEGLVPAITHVAAGKLEKFTVFGSDYPTRDGSCVRDYIHVMDIAEAHVSALEYLMEQKEASLYDVINLGTGNGITVLEMIQAFEKATGKKLPYTIGERRAGDVVAVYSDNSKAKKLLGWQPVRSLEEMMRSAWRWQEAEMERQPPANTTAEAKGQ